MISRLVFAIILALSLLGGAILLGYQYGWSFSSDSDWLPIAWAEDDEEEDEDDEDEEDRKVEEGSSEPVEKIVTTYKEVQRTIVVLDEKFKKDTDGDMLVDGLDPDPAVSQLAYFMDDDEDAVPNALDRYPGEDDFFTFDDSDDQDHDGIIDTFLAVFER